MNKQNANYLYSELLLEHKKEGGIIATCYSVDES